MSTSGTETQQVLVVEDDPVTREHFVRAVRHVPGLAVLAQVGSIREARRWLDGAHPPQIMLVDLGLPDGHGIELIRRHRKRAPEALVLVITVFGEESTVIESILAGASGYLLKDGASLEIAGAIQALLDGGSPLSASVARHVLRMARGASREAPSRAPAPAQGNARPRLTKRELEILEIIGRGFSSAEAAAILQLSVHTVIAHTRSIHRKLEVSSRAEAIFEAVSRGLIRLSGRD